MAVAGAAAGAAAGGAAGAQTGTPPSPMPSPSPAINPVQQVVSQLFAEAVSSGTSHRKNARKLRKLHRQCAQRRREDPQRPDDLAEAVWQCVLQIIAAKQDAVETARAFRFLTAYLTLLNHDAPPASGDAPEEERDATLSAMLVETLLTRAMLGLEARDKHVRRRVCEVISLLLAHLSEITDATDAALTEGLAVRATDKEASVRAKALLALAKLVTGDGDGDGDRDGDADRDAGDDLARGADPILERITQAHNDKSPLVRRMVCAVLEPSPRHLPYLMQFTRDREASVRAVAFARLVAAPRLHDHLTRSQRDDLLARSLSDRDTAVKKQGLKLFFEAWLPRAADDVVLFLERIDVVRGHAARPLLRAYFFQNAARIEDALAYHTSEWQQLTPERAAFYVEWLLWCQETAREAAWEAVCPTLTQLTHLLGHYLAQIEQLPPIEDTVAAGDGLDPPTLSDHDAAVLEQRQALEWILTALFRLACQQDTTDEIGRRRMVAWIAGAVGHPAWDTAHVATLIKTMRYLCENEKDFVQLVTETVHDLHDVDGDDDAATATTTTAATAAAAAADAAVSGPHGDGDGDDGPRLRLAPEGRLVSVDDDLESSQDGEGDHGDHGNDAARRRRSRERDDVAGAMSSASMRTALGDHDDDHRAALPGADVAMGEDDATSLASATAAAATVAPGPSRDSAAAATATDEDREDRLLQKAYRCLEIVQAAAARIDAFHPALRGWIETFCVPAIRRPLAPFQSIGYGCLALICLLNREVAVEHMPLFFHAFRMGTDDMKGLAMNSLFDLILCFGPETVFSDAAMTRGAFEIDSLLGFCQQTLDYEALNNRALFAIGIEGNCKLWIRQYLDNDEILGHLIVLAYHPQTAELPEVRATIRAALPVFGLLTRDHQNRLARVVVPALLQLLEQAEASRGALMEVAQIGRDLLAWTDRRHLRIPTPRRYPLRAAATRANRRRLGDDGDDGDGGDGGGAADNAADHAADDKPEDDEAAVPEDGHLRIAYDLLVALAARLSQNATAVATPRTLIGWLRRCSLGDTVAAAAAAAAAGPAGGDGVPSPMDLVADTRPAHWRMLVDATLDVRAHRGSLDGLSRVSFNKFMTQLNTVVMADGAFVRNPDNVVLARQLLVHE
ncbi:hypothetical protein CXG81DRAFT_19368 [Caulochytrium protostelioides]|uniref:Nuclear condensin complex subunit 3 C-terminal domain-containing protein n=1 Tax=Caulochytrium protostelioides TaxID=1555241 RepID=A0A4P9X6D2_9FUNG|nr:hypothetical protein CXG81DRAFT_19368 [Caulochytrium protostelioides]|eukprot:RKP00712.1 hypothetical protein CXG81DRAFT_19368 [Caulochytrium protostelioides]